MFAKSFSFRPNNETFDEAARQLLVQDGSEVIVEIVDPAELEQVAGADLIGGV